MPYCVPSVVHKESLDCLWWAWWSVRQLGMARQKNAMTATNFVQYETGETAKITWKQVWLII